MRLVRLLLGSVLLAAAILLALTLLSRGGSTPDSAPPTATPPASAPPGPTPPSPAPPARAHPPPRRPPEVTGPTRFARRIAAGSHLRRLAAEIRAPGADRAAILEDFLSLKRHALEADGRLPQDLDGAVLALSEPPRDRETLRLHEGARGLLRVWSLAEHFDDPALERSEWLLERLGVVTGARLDDGADVLATPGLGGDVFPRQRTWPGARGIYFRDDRYAAVLSALPRSLREEVLKHELIHAYVHATAGALMGRRFVSEGLAEYLRFLQPADGGLAIPRAYFRNNLARLERILSFYEAMGCDLRPLQPRRLVSLPPWRFYVLPFGYELAQATMVYVGGEVVEEALKEKTDRPLVEAIERVRWDAFREWLKEGAEGGDADSAVVVRDTDPTHAREGVTPWDVLFDIGVRLPGGITDMEVAVEDAIRSPERIAAVLGMILASAEDPVVVATDVSTRMDGAMGPVALPAPLEEAGPEFLSASPRDFVTSLFRVLAARTGPMPRLVGLTAEPRLLEDLRIVEPCEVDALPGWLARSGLSGAPLVLCIAQPLPEGARTAAIAGLEAFPGTVLVADLAPEGPGAAWSLARALARGGRAPTVAYWRPRD